MKLCVNCTHSKNGFASRELVCQHPDAVISENVVTGELKRKTCSTERSDNGACRVVGLNFEESEKKNTAGNKFMNWFLS